MFIHIKFTTSNNPYVLRDTKQLYKWLKNYYIEIVKFENLVLYCTATERKTPATREQKKGNAREIAIDTISSQFRDEYATSWKEAAEVQNVLRTLAIKYGLIREFKENAII